MLKMKKNLFFQVLLILFFSISAGIFTVLIFPNAYLLAWVSGIFLIVVGFYPFFIGLKKRKLDLFEPIFLFTAYFILEMAIRGLWDLKTGSPILSPLYDTTSSSYYYLLSKVFLYSISALIIFYIGYYLKLGNIIANSLPRLPKIYWTKPQLIIAVGLSFIIGIFAIILSSKSSPQLGELSWEYPLGSLPLIGLALLYINSCIKEKHFLEIFFIFLIILFSFFLFFVLNSGKTSIFEACLLVLVIYNYFKKQITLKKTLVVLFFLLLISPIVVGYYDFRNWPETKDYYISVIPHPTKIFEPIIIRSYGADAFALILDKTSEFKIGGSLSELLWFYIPRSLWEEKPYGYSFVLGKTYPTIPGPFSIPSLEGELYVNFAWVGIGIGFLLTGIIFRAIYSYFIQINKSEITILLYAIISPIIILFSQGALGEGMSRVLIKLILTFVIIFPLMMKLFPQNKLI